MQDCIICMSAIPHAHICAPSPRSAGADSLAGDKLGPFNLSIPCHGRCHAFLAAYGLPLLALGGGGYKVKVRGGVVAQLYVCVCVGGVGLRVGGGGNGGGWMCG